MDSTEIVQRQLDAYNRRDLETFVACFHNDVQVFDLSSPKPRMSGTEELQKNYAALFQGSPNLKCEILSRKIFGNFIIDEESISGSSKFPDGFRVAAIYQVENALIKKVWFTK